MNSGQCFVVVVAVATTNFFGQFVVGFESEKQCSADLRAFEGPRLVRNFGGKAADPQTARVCATNMKNPRRR